MRKHCLGYVERIQEVMSKVTGAEDLGERYPAILEETVQIRLDLIRDTPNLKAEELQIIDFVLRRQDEAIRYVLNRDWHKRLAT